MWIYNTETNNAKNTKDFNSLTIVVTSNGEYELLGKTNGFGNTTIARFDTQENANRLLRNIMSCIERGQRTFLIP